MPSRFEAYGLVFIEALCLGVPIVAIDDYEMTHFVENNKSGCLVESYDHKELAKAIKKVLKDSSMKAFVVENHDKYLEEYSWDSVAVRIKNVIEKRD